MANDEAPPRRRIQLEPEPARPEQTPAKVALVIGYVYEVPASAIKCLIWNGFENPANRGCFSRCRHYEVCKMLFDNEPPAGTTIKVTEG